MNKKKVVAGILAFALISVMGLLGCAYENEMVKDVPVDQRAKLYLVDRSDKSRDYLDYLDDQKTGFLKIGRVSWQDKRQQLTKPIFEVTAGQHKVTVSSERDLLPVKKKYEATYNFEAGKRYKLQVGSDPNWSIAEAAKNLLIPDSYVLVITDMDAPKKEQEKIIIQIPTPGAKK
jgi:hypothetical protein